MSKGATLLLALALGLAACAAALTLAAPAGAPPERAREFHGLVGGLGFGPALDLSPCAFGLDPRLCPACAWEWGPVPGGAAFCPHHADSVLAYPPLAPEGAGGPGAPHALP
jgi:hypothetical protein